MRSTSHLLATLNENPSYKLTLDRQDEKLAREAGVRFSIDQIVGLPMDEFNDLLSKQDSPTLSHLI